MQVAASKNVSDQTGPTAIDDLTVEIVRISIVVIGATILCQHRRVDEVEFPDQQRGGGTNKIAHVAFANIWQLFTLDLAGSAAMPGIFALGVGMNAGHHDLLAGCQYLDLLCTAIRCGKRVCDL